MDPEENEKEEEERIRVRAEEELENSGASSPRVRGWPPLVICSSDIIAKSYSEALQRAYRVRYLSADSTSSLFLPPRPVHPCFAAPPEILPLCASLFVTLPANNAVPPITVRVSAARPLKFAICRYRRSKKHSLGP